MSKTVQFTINLNGNAVSGVATLTDKVNELSRATGKAQGAFAGLTTCWRRDEKGNPSWIWRGRLTGWKPSRLWANIVKRLRGFVFGRVVDVELPDELETVLEVGSFGLGEGVEETEGGDESDLLGLDGHVLLGCGDDLPESGEEVLELIVGDKKLDFWRRNGVFGVVARVVEEVRDAVERACDGVVIIWERDFYGGG